ncbi:unnamed protein product [Ectocarpus fasciculatus]
MSRCSWRSAEALHKRRAERKRVERADERARERLKREEEEWHITGERAFRPKERSYPHGGGVDATACKGFLDLAERAMHLYDRGKAQTEEMSAALASLEQKNAALAQACHGYEDKHSSHLTPDRVKSGKWEVGTKELRLFVEATKRMTPAQRHTFTQVLAPHRDKSDGYIGPVEPLAVSLQRARNASIEHAVSGAIFSSGSPPSSSGGGDGGGGGKSGGVGRFSRGLRAVVVRPPPSAAAST